MDGERFQVRRNRLQWLLVAGACLVMAAAGGADGSKAHQNAEMLMLRHATHQGQDVIAITIGDIELQADSLAIVYADGKRATVKPTAQGKVAFVGAAFGGSGTVESSSISSPLRGGLLGKRGNRRLGGAK